MDFVQCADALTALNAKLAGMDETAANYAATRTMQWPLSAVSGDGVYGTCPTGYVLVHWCMESIGGRVIAAITCVVQWPLSSYM
jgi:hypothetical protein